MSTTTQSLNPKISQSLNPPALSARWLWTHYLPVAKLTLLAGDPGVGKSLLALDLAARLSRGLPMPPHPLSALVPQSLSASPSPSLTASLPHSLTASSSLILSAEDSPDTLYARLIAANADLHRLIIPPPQDTANPDLKPQPDPFDDPFDDDLDAKPARKAKPKLPQTYSNTELFGTLQFSLTNPAAIAELHAICKAHKDLRLLILDPLPAFFPGCSRADTVRTRLAPLLQLAARFNLAILGTTHLRKTTAPTALYRALDSLAFTALARSVFFVTKDPDDPARRLLLPAKTNLASDTTNLALAFRIQDNHLAWEQDPLPHTADTLLSHPPADPFTRTQLEEAADFLTQTLAPGPAPANIILSEAHSIGISTRTLKRAKARLQVQVYRQGFDRGSWHWRLPNAPANNC